MGITQIKLPNFNFKSSDYPNFNIKTPPKLPNILAPVFCQAKLIEKAAWKSPRLKRKITWTKASLLCSMLIFRGVKDVKLGTLRGTWWFSTVPWLLCDEGWWRLVQRYPKLFALIGRVQPWKKGNEVINPTASMLWIPYTVYLNAYQLVQPSLRTCISCRTSAVVLSTAIGMTSTTGWLESTNMLQWFPDLVVPGISSF